MENLHLMQSNGTPIAIKKGCPAALKSNKIKYATCYYAEVAPKQYMLFQNRVIGPFSIWLSDYLFHKPITITSDMQSYGVEFHQMLEGAAMFSFDKGGVWFIESSGDYNVLINGELHTIVAFTGPPVRTLDIHVDDDYFRKFALLHPMLTPLVNALDNHQSDSLFTRSAHSSVELQFLLTELIHIFRKSINDKKDIQNKTNQEIFDLLESSLRHMATPPSKESKKHNFQQADLDKIVQAKDYIEDNVIHPEVLKQATDQLYLNKSKLIEGFKLWLGASPKQYVISKKLERAKVFMEEVSGASCQEIAMSVGYTNAAYFSQLFFRHEGMRIDDYRRMIHMKK